MKNAPIAGCIGVWVPEDAGNPFVHQRGVGGLGGPNLEGKELRLGDTGSAISVTVATDMTSGASNVAYDSLMPLSVP